MKYLFKKLPITVVFFANMLLQANATEFINETPKIEQNLDAFHQAAAEANFDKYFSLLAKEAIFIGTDGNERWTKESFAEFVRPYFSEGRGWLYTPTERHVTVLANKSVAFFDESLINASYGQTRGSGVLIKTEQGWKIAQYNLSIPMPNALTKDLVQQIKQFHQAQSKMKGSSGND
ncbi:nuclear transport factor 2 family protein [Thalassotalea atypica]|uniref:nuclear transport factor 2 family protein n=1 Tax=Thalassotalea atypica TaxID=2054316 RepID=UPI002572FC94|nr:nuclear transport factor 2 family protein [Thalassotalea atypica]